MKLGLVFVCAAGAAACSPATAATGASATSARTTPERVRIYPVYRFDFTLNSGEGPGSDSDRHYSMVLEQGTEGRVETGIDVPVGSGGRTPRIDTGVNVRCKFARDGDDLLLHTVLTLSDVGSGDERSSNRKIEMIGDALVAPGKPALVGTIADATTHSRYELSVAATRLH